MLDEMEDFCCYPRYNYNFVLLRKNSKLRLIVLNRIDYN